MAAPSIIGSGNITIVVSGDGHNVSVCRCPYLTLHRPPRRVPNLEIEILYSHLEAIPFVARESDLARLHSWLAGPAPISVFTVTGAGGSGKTRLARELMNRVDQAWDCGFAGGFEPPHALAQAPPPALRRERPLLVAVDYAASHTEPLRELLQDLARYGTPFPKLRLLLLERVAGQTQGWYQRLFDYSQTSGTASLFHQSGGPDPISAVEETSRRREILQRTLAASTAFHSHAQPPLSDSIPDRLLQHEQWGDPLVVMMAALASWETGLYGALQLSRPDLAVHLAGRERTRIEKRRPQPPAPRLLAHLAAHLTFCGGLSDAQLLAAAKEESQALELDYPGGPGQLASELDDVLPSRTVLPDIVGEAFVLLTAPPGVDRAARRAGGATVKTLVRTLQDFYDPHHVRPESDSGPAANGGLAAQWIREVAKTDRFELLMDLEANMPDSSLELRDLAAEVTDRLLGLLEIVAKGHADPDLRAARARLFNNQGVRLGELGRREEAEAAAREAVSVYRQLAKASPDAFLPNLAVSLNNHGAMLSELGRREEAEAAAREAVSIRRQLARARPDAFLPDLAASLNNHGNRLSELGRREGAEAAAREAVTVYRQLARTRPDAFLPDLAASLNNHGNRLSELGRREEAEAAAREAVSIRRQLARARPDAFLPDLAMSLNNHGTMLGELGRREEAEAAAREAVTVYRQLARTRPDAFLPDLAASLNNHGNRLSELGRREEAEAAAREAVSIRRQLAQARPDAFLPNLAASLNNHGNRLSELGRREEAEAAAREAVSIRRQLARARPDAFLPNLAAALHNHGTRLSELGRREEAEAAAREAVTVYRQLAQARPDAFLPDLAASLNNHGNRLSALGRREEAEAAAREAVSIRRQLAQARPDAFLPDLAASLNNHGTMLSALGRREEAEAAAREAVSVYRQLAEARPDAFLPDLATSLLTLGSIIAEPADAARHFREGIEALSLPFANRPAAHAHLMAALCQSYIHASEQAGVAPDIAALTPTLAIFAKLKPGEPQQP